MADYNIKFSYKGMGKAASNTRKKVIQSQKQAEKKGGGSGDRASVASIKALNSSITKLIASNKDLANAMRGQRPGSSPSSSGGGGRGGGGGGIKSGGIASLGMAGFVIQKINQVGNAYIQKAAEQKGNVGTAGFRYGKGMYTGTEMGAGMKSYAQKSGEFSGGIGWGVVRDSYKNEAGEVIPAKSGHKLSKSKMTKANKSALNVGGIFGLSSSETLGQAGTFKRSGANYGQAANMAAGAGIQTEIPMLLSGMSSIMEEAITKGLDASDFSKDLGKEIIAFATLDGKKNVGAALSAMKAFSGTKQQVGEGKLSGFAGVYTARAGRKMLNKRITGAGGEAYMKKAVKSGHLTKKDAEKVKALGPNATQEEIQNAVGLTTYMGLEERFVRQQSDVKMGVAAAAEYQNERGKKSKGSPTDMYHFRKMTNGAFGDAEQNERYYKAAEKQRRGEVVDWDEVGKKGEKSLKIRGAAVKHSSSAFAVGQQNRRDNVLLSKGGSFAVTSLKLEKSLLKLAKEGADPALVAVKAFGVAVERVTGLVDVVANGSVVEQAKAFNEIRKKQGFGTAFTTSGADLQKYYNKNMRE